MWDWARFALARYPLDFRTCIYIYICIYIEYTCIWICVYLWNLYTYTYVWTDLQLFEVIIGVIRCVLLDSLPRVASGSTRQCSHDWSRQYLRGRRLGLSPLPCPGFLWKWSSPSFGSYVPKGYLSFPCFSIAWGLATCLENCRYEGNVDDVDAKGPPVYKQILC